MPLFRKINCEKGWGGIWKITETFDELCDMLPHSACYREHAFHFAAERRRLEYVAVRLLIFTLTGEELQVEYLPAVLFSVTEDFSFPFPIRSDMQRCCFRKNMKPDLT